MRTKIDWKNPEEVKEHNKKWYQRNKGRILQKQKQDYHRDKSYHENYYLKNKDDPLFKSKRKEYYEKNKEKIMQKQRERLEQNPGGKERVNEYQREYYKKKKKGWNQRPDVKKRVNDSQKENYWKRKENDKDFVVKKRLRRLLLDVLKYYTQTGKIYSSKKYKVDYKAIIEHIKPFPDNLQDYDIHHIRPLFTFNFVNPDGSTNLEEVKKAFAPENHQLLLRTDHKKINHFKIQLTK